MRRVLMMIGAISAAASAGPLSKFDTKKPDVSFTSTLAMGDVERCLIDLDGWFAPSVFRQPDRPDDVQMLWANGDGFSIGRVDLHRDNTGVTVKAWSLGKQARQCGGQS